MKRRLERPALEGEAGTTEGSAVNADTQYTKAAAKRLPPRRCMRLMVALRKGPVTREGADRVAPASNGPHYISILRHKFGLQLPCERVDFITKDGDASWYGRYHATPNDRVLIAELLERMGVQL